MGAIMFVISHLLDMWRMMIVLTVITDIINLIMNKTHTEIIEEAKDKFLKSLPEKDFIEVIFKEGKFTSVTDFGTLMGWFSSKLQEAEQRGRRETALQIVNDLQKMRENPGHAEVGTVGAIQWGIMKGWGIEPGELKGKPDGK